MPSADKVVIVGASGNAANVDSSGNLATTATLSGSIAVTTDATATAADPTYIEASSDALSVNLQGQIRSQNNAYRGALTSRSGALTLGGTAQTLAAANTSRRYLLIQNPSTAAGQNIVTAESLYIRFTSAAGVNAGTSFELTPGGSFVMETSFVSTELVSVNAATTAHIWIAVEG